MAADVTAVTEAAEPEVAPPGVNPQAAPSMARKHDLNEAAGVEVRGV